MPDQSAQRDSYHTGAQAASSPGNPAAPKVNPVFTGDFSHMGSKVGLYGVTPVTRAAAIAAPTVASASYVQAQITSMVTAINDLRNALKNVGITS